MRGLGRVVVLALAATGTVAEPHGYAELQTRVKKIDAAIDSMLDKMQHQGSASYWQKHSTDAAPAQRDDDGRAAVASAAASASASAENERELRQHLTEVETKLDLLLDHLSDDSSPSRGAASYWQTHASRSRGAGAAGPGPVSGLAKARTCIGDARGSVVLAAGQLNLNAFNASDPSEEAAATRLVDRQVGVAEDKVRCAERQLTAGEPNHGSTSYWKKNSAGDSGLGNVELFAFALGGLLVGGSLAGISALQRRRDDVDAPGASEYLMIA